MEITVHRGTHQIGGCATEIKSGHTRILVDFGAELDEDPKPLDLAGATKGETEYDAAFFTHYHGDHVGMLDSLNDDIPLYIGRLSKRIMQLLNKRMKSYDEDRVNSMIEYEEGVPIKIGSLTVTPYHVDHSALDSHMLLIEAEGKRVLHTGDFRSHGFRGAMLTETLDRIGKVNVLVCEGTVLNREDHKNMTEAELSEKAAEILRDNKYVFVLCASTNIDRVAAFCNAVPRGKYCLCDGFQSDVIEAVKEDPDFQDEAYKFPKKLIYSSRIEDRYKERGFCMFVRANSRNRALLERYKDLNPAIVYSMWNGYRNKASMKDFLDGFNPIYLHTSGHADPSSILMMIDKTSPDFVIPIHTENPERLKELCGDTMVVVPYDGDPVIVGEDAGQTRQSQPEKVKDRKERFMDEGTIELDGKVYRVDEIYKALTGRSDEGKWIEAIISNIEKIEAGPYKLSKRLDFDFHRSRNIKAFDEEMLNAAIEHEGDTGTFITEKWICKEIVGRTFDCIGEIVDWQVPLKHPMVKGEDPEEHKKHNDGMGEIDNLSVNEEEGCAYLLEFKKPYSDELPLRAIMEAYTYWRSVGGKDSHEFIENSAAKDRGIKELRKAIVIFESSPIHEQLERNRKLYKKLLEDLEVECFIATLDTEKNADLEKKLGPRMNKKFRIYISKNIRPWA